MGLVNFVVDFGEFLGEMSEGELLGFLDLFTADVVPGGLDVGQGAGVHGLDVGGGELEKHGASEGLIVYCFGLYTTEYTFS